MRMRSGWMDGVMEWWSDGVLKRHASTPWLHDSTTPSPRVALISEQYAPDMSSTAQLFEELLHELAARGIETTACAMTPGYIKNVARAPLKEMRKGVRVWRMPRLPFARTNRIGEALNWVWATACLSWMALWIPRSTPLIVGTNPPMAHIVGALMKILKGQRFIALFYDLHPELSCAVGVLRKGSWVDRVWRRVNSWALRHADLALSLGPYMTQSIKARCATVPTLIMHNWCDAKTVRCLKKEESRFAREHDLLDKFVVLFSGNMGWRQRLEILLDVAAEVQDTPIRFVFIGEGAKKAKLHETAQQRGLKNVLFFPYQPRELMEHSLAAADLSVVSQEREVIGFGVPSKIYTYMASGRALLGLAGEPCEVIDMINEHQCGWTFDEDHDRDAIVAKLRELLRNREACSEAGRRARREFEEHYSLEVIAQQYADVIRQHCAMEPAPHWFARLFSRKPSSQAERELAELKQEYLKRKITAPPKHANGVHENSPLEGGQGGVTRHRKQSEMQVEKD